MLAPLVFVLLVAVSVILVAAALWAWRNGTLHPTEQERVDLEFERIVRRLDVPST